MIPTPPRSYAPEIMDRPDNPPAALEGALRDLRHVNRWFGGRRCLIDALRPFLETTSGPALTLLDVGTGAADLPIAAVQHAVELERPIEITAVDRDPVTVAVATRLTEGYPQIRVLRADAFRLPFGRAAFDVVTASLFLHHFREDEIDHLLAGFCRLARRAVLINDLRRHRVPWAFTHVFGRLTRRHPMFVHDGPLSVLRGFTPDELRAAAGRCGATRFRLERRWPYRLVLTLETC